MLAVNWQRQSFSSSTCRKVNEAEEEQVDCHQVQSHAIKGVGQGRYLAMLASEEEQIQSSKGRQTSSSFARLRRLQ